MPRCRPFGKGWLLRPFTDISKRTLVELCEQNGWEYVHDPSNSDVSIDRNYIRWEIVPKVRKRFAHFEASLVPESLPFIHAWEYSPRPIDDKLDEGGVRCWLQHASVIARASVIREICTQVHAKSDSTIVIQVADDANVCRFQNHLHIVPIAQQSNLSEIITGAEALLGSGILSFESGLGLPPSKKLNLGYRKGGETIRVRGMLRKVKQLFQEANVPWWQRTNWPLLYEGTSLVCIPNIACADGLPLTDDGLIPRWKPSTWADRLQAGR